VTVTVWQDREKRKLFPVFFFLESFVLLQNGKNPIIMDIELAKNG